MIKYKKSEHGQAIVLVAFAIIGLIGITALAIDGSNAFSDRRHAQSAADNAALAAALAKAKGESYETAGYSLATTNGYTTGTMSTVAVSNPPGVGCGGVSIQDMITLQPYSPDYGADSYNNYVSVVIHSTVDTYFGGVVGINQLHNCVQSVARVVIGEHRPYAYGNAIAAMDCHASRAINDTGASNTVTIDGGIFSNSDAEDGFYALKEDGLLIDPGYGGTAVGGFDLGFTQPGDWSDHQANLQVDCPTPDYWYPAYGTPYFPDPSGLCDQTYNDFPPAKFLTHIGGKQVYQLDNNTTYCITGEFRQQANRDVNGSGVHFILLNEGLRWNGNAGFFLTAGVGEDDPLSGILIYLPKGNSSDLKINGTADSVLSGTIFAPESNVALLGSYNGQSWAAQVIGRTVDLSGSSNLIIDYDQGITGGYTPPSIFELTK